MDQGQQSNSINAHLQALLLHHRVRYHILDDLKHFHYYRLFLLVYRSIKGDHHRDQLPYILDDDIQVFEEQEEASLDV